MSCFPNSALSDESTHVTPSCTQTSGIRVHSLSVILLIRNVKFLLLKLCNMHSLQNPASTGQALTHVAALCCIRHTTAAVDHGSQTRLMHPSTACCFSAAMQRIGTVNQESQPPPMLCGIHAVILCVTHTSNMCQPALPTVLLECLSWLGKHSKQV